MNLISVGDLAQLFVKRSASTAQFAFDRSRSLGLLGARLEAEKMRVAGGHISRVSPEFGRQAAEMLRTRTLPGGQVRRSGVQITPDLAARLRARLAIERGALGPVVRASRVVSNPRQAALIHAAASRGFGLGGKNPIH